jgi:hypothetical protein
VAHFFGSTELPRNGGSYGFRREYVLPSEFTPYKTLAECPPTSYDTRLKLVRQYSNLSDVAFGQFTRQSKSAGLATTDKKVPVGLLTGQLGSANFVPKQDSIGYGTFYELISEALATRMLRRRAQKVFANDAATEIRFPRLAGK